MDPKPVKMTIRYGICHINTKNTKHVYIVSLNPSNKRTPEYRVATYKAI
jgi:hypothetical protein